MLEAGIIVALVMVIAELVKRGLKKVMAEDLVTQVAPLIVIVLGAGLNVLNALLFAPEVLPIQALKEGILLAVTAAGIYSGTKALVGKS